MVALRAVIRDSGEHFVAAATQKQSGFYGDVPAAEAEAIKLGLETAETANCMPLIIKFDCQEVVDLIAGRKCSKIEIVWTISRIQERPRRLNHTTLRHISRLCNGIAHSLAKMVLNIVKLVMWLDNCPSHLLYLFSRLNQ